MSSHIDFRTMPANVPVMCIPRVYTNINESRIRKIFDDLNMGTIDRIDIVSAKSGEKGEKFNRVFVHFRRWNDTENARTARERLLNGKEIKIIYDDPWFWKISAYREPERSRQSSHKPSAGKPLQFDSDEERKPIERRDERRRPDERRRDDSRERHRPVEREHKQSGGIPKVEAKSPSCSSPRERTAEKEDHEDEGLKVEYGNLAIPCIKNKNKNFYPAKSLKIEDEKEIEKA